MAAIRYIREDGRFGTEQTFAAGRSKVWFGPESAALTKGGNQTFAALAKSYYSGPNAAIQHRFSYDERRLRKLILR